VDNIRFGENDTDANDDGLPEAWELQAGLDPNNAASVRVRSIRLQLRA
jgi:hypothetical protein